MSPTSLVICNLLKQWLLSSILIRQIVLIRKIICISGLGINTFTKMRTSFEVVDTFRDSRVKVCVKHKVKWLSLMNALDDRNLFLRWIVWLYPILLGVPFVFLVVIVGLTFSSQRILSSTVLSFGMLIVVQQLKKYSQILPSVNRSHRMIL